MPTLAADYEIVMLAHLDRASHDWLSGLELTHGNGQTRLLARQLDQAALHGLLRRIRDSGAILYRVQRLARPSAGSH